MRAFFVLLALAAINGCATSFEPKPLSPSHPASVEAEEAPRPAMKRLITTDELTRQTKAQLARNTVPDPDYQDDGMAQDLGAMKGMEGMDHSKMKATTPAPTDGGSARSSPAPTVYTCVMHPQVQQSTPGNCPKCGMTLVKKKATAQ